MRLQTLFKGMLLSQGYVATLRALREIAPEALPSAPVGNAAAEDTNAPDAATHDAATPDAATPDAATSDATQEIDLAGSMPWQLAYARRSPLRPAQSPARVATGAPARTSAAARAPAIATAGGAAGACCA